MTAATTFPEGDVRRNWLKAERYPQFATEVSKTDQIRPLARDGRTLAQVALQFVLGHPAVTLSIPGAKRPSQVEENVLASEGAPPLSPDELHFLDEIFARP